jgi:hypothetical protein
MKYRANSEHRAGPDPRAPGDLNRDSEARLAVGDAKGVDNAVGVAIDVGVGPKVSDIVKPSEPFIRSFIVESVNSPLPDNKCENK